MFSSKQSKTIPVSSGPTFMCVFIPFKLVSHLKNGLFEIKWHPATFCDKILSLGLSNDDNNGYLMEG